MIRQSGIKAFTPQVQAVDFNGTYYYYLRNGQGDIVKLIDGNRNTVVEYAYDSWGKPLSCTGTLATTLGVLNPFRYRGYVFDEETGFYYLKSRYYDPDTCRFISADVLLSTGQGVLGHNCYAYCMNAPVSGYDPDGKSMTAILIGIAVAGVIGGLISKASGESFATGFLGGAFAATVVAFGVGIAAVFCETAAATCLITGLFGALGAHGAYDMEIMAEKKEYDKGTDTLRMIFGLLSGVITGGSFKLFEGMPDDWTRAVSECFIGVVQNGSTSFIEFALEFILNASDVIHGNNPSNNSTILPGNDPNFQYIDPFGAD